jgi:hypothetical protein
MAPKAAGGVLDPLERRVQPFSHGVRDAVQGVVRAIVPDALTQRQRRFNLNPPRLPYEGILGSSAALTSFENMMRISAKLGGFIVSAWLAHWPSSLFAQGRPELPLRRWAHPAVTSASGFLDIQLADTAAELRSAALRRAMLLTRTPTADSPRRWPWYALGGGVLGGVAVTVWAVSHCDAGCHDDGALSHLPPYVLGGALLGAVVGSVVGLIVDSATSATASAPNRP